MKKLISLICVLVLAVMLVPVGARADIIYEPWDDPFYEEHREECEYVSRTYTANGPNGDVTVYESPESDWKEKVIANGEKLWISYTYEAADGVLWGCCEFWDEDIIGWVPMDYLVVVYDGISFDEEYGDQFVNEDGQLDTRYRGQTIYFWTYPGCRESSWYTLPADADWMPEYRVLYTDADGRTWGKLTYFMGHRDSWICLDDPTADFDTLYPEGIPETEPVPTETQAEPVKEIVPMGDRSMKLPAIAAVAAVVAVTAVLLILLKRKK